MDQLKQIPQEIQILSAPCFLATKFEAFNNQWRRLSDGVMILKILSTFIDNRTSIVQEILNDVPEIRVFLRFRI